MRCVPTDPWSGCDASPTRQTTGSPPAPSVVAAPRGRSDHQISIDFVEELRGASASGDESALLLQACDACADDPDADLLVTAANGSG